MASKANVSGIRLPQGAFFRIFSTVIDVFITLIAAIMIHMETAYRLNDSAVNTTADCTCTDFNAIPTNITLNAGLATIVLIVIYGVVAVIALGVNLGSMYYKLQDKKCSDSTCWKVMVFLLTIFHGNLAITTGVLYLLGDNYINAFCDMEISSGTDNVTLCGKMIFKASTAQMEQIKLEQVQCEKVANDVMGFALLLNFIVGKLEDGPLKGRNKWTTYKFSDRHTRWIKLLSSLSNISTFDQILTVILASVLSEETDSCTSGVNITSGLLYSLIVLMVIIAAFWRFGKACATKYLDEEDETDEEKLGTLKFILQLITGISIVIFSALYLLADIPWPWSCQGLCTTIEAQTVRVALLGISIPFLLVLCVVYCCVVTFPSLCPKIFDAEVEDKEE